MSYVTILKDSFRDYSSSSYKKLFAGRKLAQHTSVLFLIWLTVGIAYPLYFAFITSYLQSRSSYVANTTLNHTYKIYCIVSTVGVIGPIAAGFCVETRFGRRWMMAISSVLTGIFLFSSVTVNTEVSDIAFQCATAIVGNFRKCNPLSVEPNSFQDHS
jgi:MFS family permease